MKTNKQKAKELDRVEERLKGFLRVYQDLLKTFTEDSKNPEYAEIAQQYFGGKASTYEKVIKDTEELLGLITPEGSQEKEKSLCELLA